MVRERPHLLARFLTTVTVSWFAVSCSGTSEALKSLDESLNTQTEAETPTPNGKTEKNLRVRLTTINEGEICPAGGVKIEVIQLGETGQADSVITEQTDCGSESGRWTWVKASVCDPSQPGSCSEGERDPGEPLNVPAPSNSPNPLPACTSNGQSGCVAQPPYVAADLRLLAPENIKNGVSVAGVTGTFSDRPPDCFETGQENCVATGLFKAADLSALVPSSIRFGRTIAGVTGIYPSSLSPLEGSTGADLPSFSANVPAGQYQCFKSDGSRVAGSISDVGVLTPGVTDRDFSQSLYRGFLLAGDADLEPNYILSGVNIFGVSGNVVLPPKASVQEGTFFGPGLNSLEGEIAICEAAGSVGCLTSSTFKPYEPCTYDGQVNCAANSTYQAWAPITAVASASVTDADENESISFSLGRVLI